MNHTRVRTRPIADWVLVHAHVLVWTTTDFDPRPTQDDQFQLPLSSAPYYCTVFDNTQVEIEGLDWIGLD
jgi:hypothetical protein